MRRLINLRPKFGTLRTRSRGPISWLTLPGFIEVVRGKLILDTRTADRYRAYHAYAKVPYSWKNVRSTVLRVTL